MLLQAPPTIPRPQEGLSGSCEHWRYQIWRYHRCSIAPTVLTCLTLLDNSQPGGVESRPINHVTEFAVHASVYGKAQNRLAHSNSRPLAVASTHDAYFRPRHSSLTLQNAHRLIYASYRRMQSIPTGCWPSEAFGVTESQVYVRGYQESIQLSGAYATRQTS